MDISLTFTESVILTVMLKSAIAGQRDALDILRGSDEYPETVKSIESRISDMEGILAKL